MSFIIINLFYKNKFLLFVQWIIKYPIKKNSDIKAMPIVCKARKQRIQS